LSASTSDYVVRIVGGLGDTILRYLLPGDCGYVEGLRRREPRARIVCALMSTNPRAAEFVSPLFDGVICGPWDGDERGFLARWSAARSIDRSLGAWRRPAIVLSPEERAVADELDGCIALHPFAGTDNRDWSRRVDLMALVDRLCAAGLRVAVLGGSSSRREGRGAVTEREIVERFDMERPGLTNLVNRASVRLQALVASRARRFVGSFSCYHCAAFAMDTPALVLAGIEFKSFFAQAHPVYGTMSERPQTQIHYFEDGDLASRILKFAMEKASA
jgi:hypothetical protein